MTYAYVGRGRCLAVRTNSDFTKNYKCLPMSLTDEQDSVDGSHSCEYIWNFVANVTDYVNGFQR